MSSTEDLHFLTVAEASRRFRDGSLAPSTLVDALIERTRRLDPRLRSTITLAAEVAVKAAASAEAAFARGQWIGPLHGIPIGVKDCIATAGLRTTANSRLLSDWVPVEDAPAVAALRRSGAIVFAKLNLNEFAWSIPSEDDLKAPPRNPWRPASYSMGSSSGSAVAVASGLCVAALGSDAGGSVRQPAANCGVVGLKPTHGLVASTGAFAPGSICDVGPIARSVEDVAMLLDALAGGSGAYIGGFAAPRPRKDRARLAVPRHHIDAGAPDREIRAAFEQALEAFGALGVEIIDVEVEGLADAAAADFVVLNAEAFAAHERTLRARGGEYGPSARAYHLQGAFLSAADYIAAREVGDIVRGRLDRLFSDVDALATPVAPLLTAEAARASKAQPGTGGVAVFTAPFNLTGHPAIAVPCGMSAAGVPIGLQLVGRAGGEAELLWLAGIYEQATPWHTMHPADSTLVTS